MNNNFARNMSRISRSNYINNNNFTNSNSNIPSNGFNQNRNITINNSNSNYVLILYR